MKIQEQAPAKINLALNILGRRTDGYHELRMVMQSVSLCDTVTVEETGIGFALLAKPWLGADALWWSFPLGSLTTLAIAAVKADSSSVHSPPRVR